MLEYFDVFLPCALAAIGKLGASPDFTALFYFCSVLQKHHRWLMAIKDLWLQNKYYPHSRGQF